MKQGRRKNNTQTGVQAPHAHHASDEAPLLVVFLAKARHIWLNYVEQLGHDLQASACAVVSTHACSLLGRPLLHKHCPLTTAVHGDTTTTRRAHSLWRRRGRSVGESRRTCLAAAAAQSPMSRARLGALPLAPPRCQCHLQHQPLQRPSSHHTQRQHSRDTHTHMSSCLQSHHAAQSLPKGLPEQSRSQRGARYADAWCEPAQRVSMACLVELKAHLGDTSCPPAQTLPHILPAAAAAGRCPVDATQQQQALGWSKQLTA